MLHLIVDAANVAGSTPDGWWRDRPGAAVRLANRLVAALSEAPEKLAALGRHTVTDVTVHLVLEGAARRAADRLPSHPRFRVVLAPAEGDDAIVALAEELAGEDVLVVTADRELRRRVEAVGARTIGPGALLNVLPR
ncbi:hypothetical protein [Pseudonocardia sp.]|jgi:hypothetical protein|uniref:hypothetical protein n=1 Tax=Pseudonocardia sp. TaxID=60912 RepID=UPI002636CBA5|nr:hypothetical protein [Pseudonocardia sp.]MCW2722936.1 pyrophosphohydrolase [Pseudonocardia sp.]MDT7617795.1 hypothetical protein [Pseudonocardiales bacterium]